MRKCFLTGIVLIIFIFSPLEKICLMEFTAQGENISKIIVKVNKQVITSRDLDEYCNILSLQLFEGKEDNPSDSKEFRTKALQRLIDDTLILDKANQDKIDVSPSRIEGKIAQLTASYPSRKEFEESLKNKGLTINLLRQKIKEQYMLRTIIDSYVKFQVNVSPKEISDYYTEHPDNFYSLVTYVFYIAKSTEANTVKNISEVITKSGINDASSKHKDILYRMESDLKDLKPDIANIIKNLKPGKYEIKEIDQIFYLIFLDKLITPYKFSLEEVKEKIYAYLWDVKFRKKFTSWVETLRESALIENYYE